MTTAPTILIIDDDHTTVLLLEAILQQEGYRTRSAPDGRAGREAVAREHPDLVLLDVQMPGENGFAVCRHLQDDPATADIPVLFLSAEDDVASRVSGLDAGAVDYVTKPFSRAEVMARVRTHLRLSRAYRSLVELQAERLQQVAHAQQAILPRPERMPAARFAVSYRPLVEAGGDFYDVIEVGEQVIDYLVTDVSGHDLGSSLSTAAVKALLHQQAALTEAPARALQAVNRVLAAVVPDGQYLTMVYARLNRTAMRLTLVQAAHPPAIHVPRQQPAHAIELQGDVLGVFDSATFDQKDVAVSAGDRFFLLTDGLIELGDARADHQLGLDRVCQALERHRHRPLDEAIDAVVTDLVGGGRQSDDIVLLGVEI
jgi:phosphoserine phosphatase RsbU/P